MGRNVRLLFVKEIIGALRDRRTLFLTVFFPLIFYPLILGVISHFSASQRTQLEATTPTVLVMDQANDSTFLDDLRKTTAFDPIFEADKAQGLADLKSGLGQVLMTVEKSSGGPGLGLDITLFYDQTDQLAVLAAGRVRDFLQGYLKTVLQTKLDALGLSYNDLTPPLTINTENTASSSSLGRMILSRLLPYFVVLAILTGAMGLGAEITAGEKERGTIATLLVSQLSRTQIVLGKFLAVLAVSLVSSLLSAVGLLIGIRFFGSGLVPGGGAGAGFMLSLPAFGWILVVLVPLAVIIAGLVIIVGSYARTQKEASTYLLPIYMVIVLVGLVSMTSGTSFEGLRFLIPIANALYALQEIILSGLNVSHLLYTLAANVVCGGILIAASIRLFKREAVLFRS
jgi:sodium transport system permease protein